jgi:hypothetical protein
MAPNAREGDSLVEVNKVAPIQNISAKTTNSFVYNSSSLDNIDSPDYVVLFRSPSKNAVDHENQLARLIRSLDRVGLEVECRYGGKGCVLLFVRCPELRMYELVAKARYATTYINFGDGALLIS